MFGVGLVVDVVEVVEVFKHRVEPMGLSRAQILAVSDMTIEPLAIPEWGGQVFIRTMTAGDRDRFEGRVSADPHKDLRAHLAVATLCDEVGKAMFSSDDVPVLTAKSAGALDRIFTASVKLNKIGKADVAGLRKNS